jgi:hypothetical protein
LFHDLRVAGGGELIGNFDGGDFSFHLFGLWVFWDGEGVDKVGFQIVPLGAEKCLNGQKAYRSG